MSVIVSDTSPLNYLILIEAIDILPGLFREVLVPVGVAEELHHPQTPTAVMQWMSRPPTWVKIQACGIIDESLPLGKGEKEAISLAKELGVKAVLMDELKGRRVAAQHGLVVVSTLAVLEQAHFKGWVDFEKAVKTLQTKTTFRITDAILDSVIARIRHAKG